MERKGILHAASEKPSERYELVRNALTYLITLVGCAYEQW